MTKAEACLWEYVLRAGMMKGYTFNRQRPVLNYIADFMCKELMLIIEVDGITHQFDETIKKDNKRQKDLENVGFSIIRFSDNEVLLEIEIVRKKLEQIIEKIESSLQHSLMRNGKKKIHPQPPPAGDK